MRYETAKEIQYASASYIHPAYKGITIPKGSPVEPATNQPEGKFWVSGWEGIDEIWQNHLETYGILLDTTEVVTVNE